MEVAMNSEARTAAYAAFFLRVALGVMFLAHSIVLKYFTYSLSGTAQFFTSVGLWSGLAYVVFAAEVVGGLMLVFGVQVRLAALALLPILLGAVWVHSGNGWVFTSANGGWEYPLYLSVLTGVQVLLGEGAYALSPSKPLPLFSTTTA
jgi:putative oxidoreductase